MMEFIKWLRVELLRLRSFDWPSGSRGMHWLTDGVAKFSSYYIPSRLAAKIGITEEELLGLIDSPSVINELEEKSFTIGWKERCISLTWLEAGVSEWITDINQNYYEEDCKFYSEFRIRDRIIYLDGTERIVMDTGDPRRICITEEAFTEAMKQIGQNGGKHK